MVLPGDQFKALVEAPALIAALIAALLDPVRRAVAGVGVGRVGFDGLLVGFNGLLEAER